MISLAERRKVSVWGEFSPPTYILAAFTDGYHFGYGGEEV